MDVSFLHPLKSMTAARLVKDDSGARDPAAAGTATSDDTSGVRLFFILFFFFAELCEVVVERLRFFRPDLGSAFDFALFFVTRFLPFVLAVSF